MKNAYSPYQATKQGLLTMIYNKADLEHQKNMVRIATNNIVKFGDTLNNRLTIKRYKNNFEFIQRQLNQQMLEGA